MIKTSVCFILVLLSVFLVLAQDYEVTVTSISVWIKATDSSGKPIEGLTQSDFEVKEDGKKMEITCFEESASTPEIQENPEKRLNTKIAFYLDLFNTSDREMDDLRPGLEKFLDQVGDKHWEVMLVIQSPSGSLGIAVPFTKDIEQVRAELLQASADKERDMNLRANISDLSGVLEGIGQADARVRGVIMQKAYAIAEEFIEQDKAATQVSLNAIDQFANEISKMGMTDHLVVVYASGGINLHPGRIYYEMLDKAEQQMDGNRDAGDAMINQMRKNPADVEDDAKKTIGKLSRSNVTVYAIHSRGLFVEGSAKRRSAYNIDESELWRDFQDFPSRMSVETGGFLFQNSQNFSAGFDKILGDLGHQYLICYSPPPHKANSFHKIKVESNKKAVKLRHRSGYYD